MEGFLKKCKQVDTSNYSSLLHVRELSSPEERTKLNSLMGYLEIKLISGEHVNQKEVISLEMEGQYMSGVV